MLFLNGTDVHALLENRETDLIEIVREAYLAHEAGRSHLPACEFLRFPGKDRERIIPLPAFLGAPFDVAGIKWIASFPDNVDRGMERASASILMNSVQTGHPEALIEGSIISAKRTAASAALAAYHLHEPEARGSSSVQDASFVGCGLISFQIARFLIATFPDLKNLTLYDLDPARAHQLSDRLQASTARPLRVTVASSSDEALSASALVVFATTAVDPHVDTLAPCRPRSTILHVSLRDLAPQILLGADNVVDDVDHVCQAQTSVHRAEQRSGTRDFIRATLASVISGTASPRPDDDRPTVFSPFGLGVLDLALADFACTEAEAQGRGESLEDFVPAPWTERGEATPSANPSPRPRNGTPRNGR